MSPAYEYSYMMEEIMTGVISGLATSIPTGLLGIAGYVLSALALYTLAQRRGINKPWLSWIPVVNVWILGSLSDQYRYVVKGENKSKRKVLLGLNIASVVFAVVIFVIVIVMMVNLVGGAINGMDEDALLNAVLGPVIGMAGVALPLMGVGIAYAIIYFMALYDVYTSMDPGNNVLFLVLSILFNITEPFFLFFNRNKDLGMPPRKQEPVVVQPQWQAPQQPQEPQWQPQQPVQEPWENPENKDYL